MYPLPNGMFAARNQWYLAAWSSEVTRKPMERWLLNEPVAFYRTESGDPVAVSGRCPHRGFPLGESRVVGDNIQCGYHGLTFRPDGSCAAIPSQNSIPAACRIKSYSIVERWKWIWIWMGDPAAADLKLIPDHQAIGLTDPAFQSAGDTYHLVPGRYMLMHDNLFDLTHLGYLHLPTFGGGGAGADAVPKLVSDDRSVASIFEQRNIGCPPFFAGVLGYSGRVNRTFGLRLHFPCLHVGGDDIYEVLPDGSNGKCLGLLRVYHAVTPATEYTCHYFWAIGQNWQHEDSNFSANMAAALQPALQEDIMATRLIETMIQKSGGKVSELLLRADNVCVRGRKLFEKMIRAEQDQCTAVAEELSQTHSVENGTALEIRDAK
jgi:phenylpropionate dioxygenase-like ring-hydroxylating dioxygenase large terminal subunit